MSKDNVTPITKLHSDVTMVSVNEAINAWRQTRKKMNERQEKVLLRLFQAGPQGFIGGLSAKNYMSITATTIATTTRDLRDLVEKNLLKKTGERKSTRYFLNLDEKMRNRMMSNL